MLRFLPFALLALAFPAAASAPDFPAIEHVPIALLVDQGAGQVLFSRNAGEPFLPASVTKAMTALVAFDLIDSGKLREDQPIEPRPETLAAWRGKGTTMPLSPGDRPTVGELLAATTTVSANDAAMVLAEGAAGSAEAWCAMMNATAARIGMRSSHFGTPNGFPDGGRTFVSAQDLGKLADALIDGHQQLYRRYFGKAAMTWHGVTQQNHDPTIGIVPGADGIKTGHTFEAGFNFLGSAARGGRRLVVVVAGAQVEETRAKAARALLEWGFSDWDSRPLMGAGQRVGNAQVQGGDARRVALAAPRGYTLALPRGQHPVVVTRIRYTGPIAAPIAKGAQIAQLEVTVTGQPPYTLPLVAGEAIGRAGPFDRLVNGLAGLFT